MEAERMGWGERERKRERERESVCVRERERYHEVFSLVADHLSPSIYSRMTEDYS